MGAGMGLVMAPASTTIMATVPGRQVGVGSAVNDTIGEACGARGIAIIGSLSTAAYRSRLASALATAHVPGSAAHVAAGSIAAAGILSRRVGGPEGTELARTAHSAFVTAMDTGMRVAACVALAAAIAAIFALARRRQPQIAEVTRPARS